MGHFELLFPSLYLKAADLRGRDVILTMRTVAVEQVKTDRGSDNCPVVYFEETAKKATSPKDEKRLVLNKTNARTIAAMYGPETNAWQGQRISLFPTTTSMKGQTVECIRVRAQIPPAKRAVVAKADPQTVQQPATATTALADLAQSEGQTEAAPPLVAVSAAVPVNGATGMDAEHSSASATEITPLDATDSEQSGGWVSELDENGDEPPDFDG